MCRKPKRVTVVLISARVYRKFHFINLQWAFCMKLKAQSSSFVAVIFYWETVKNTENFHRHEKHCFWTTTEKIRRADIINLSELFVQSQKKLQLFNFFNLSPVNGDCRLSRKHFDALESPMSNMNRNNVVPSGKYRMHWPNLSSSPACLPLKRLLSTVKSWLSPGVCWLDWYNWHTSMRRRGICHA